MTNSRSRYVPYRLRFATIPTFPNYLMNREGQVKNRATQQILNPKDFRGGFARYNLYRNGWSNTVRIDELFLDTFGRTLSLDD